MAKASPQPPHYDLYKSVSPPSAAHPPPPEAEQPYAIEPYVKSARETVMVGVTAVRGAWESCEKAWTTTSTAVRRTISFIPPEERSATGLLFVGMAGVAASFTFPRRAWIRRVVVFPAGISAAVYAFYPKSSTKVVSVVSDAITNADFAKSFASVFSTSPSTPSSSPVPVPSPLSRSAPSAPPAASAAAGPKPTAAVAAAPAAAAASVASATKSTTTTNTAATTPSTSTASASGPASAGKASPPSAPAAPAPSVAAVGDKDFGQSHPEDLATYTTRR